MNLGQARVRLVQVGAVLGTAALVAGCGSQYRAVVTPVNPSGPAPQPTALVAVVSAPSPTSAGVATILDYSGDTIVATAPIGPGPSAFTVDGSGSTGYTINSDGTLTNFPFSSNLQKKNVNYTTVPTTAQPVNLFSPSSGLWAADLCSFDPVKTACTWDTTPLSTNYSGVDVFTGSPQTFKLAIPLAPTPVAIVGPVTAGQRNFAITQGNSQGGNVSSGMACNTPSSVTVNGEVDALETTNTISAYIPVGICPVYGVESGDLKRLFVLNRGSDTVSVINVQSDALNTCAPFTDPNTGRTVTCHSTLPLSTAAVTATGITPPNGTAGMTTTAGPVYAEYNAATNQLVIADYDGNTISIIDVSLDEYGNDSATFGTTYTVPVGTNPASLTVLVDGSRAYTANQADSTVSIVNLASHTLQKPAPLPVEGHPRTVVSSQNSSYGKVYVASPDSPYLTIIQTGGTNPDIVDTTILTGGNIVDVRVSTQNGTSGNANVNSRQPGAGQPCYLPPALMVSTYGSSYTSKNCQTMP